MLKKRGGQMQISFGMIFSIVLIAIFIFVAGYAIYSFLDMRCTWSNGAFTKDLRDQVDSVFRSSGKDVLFKGDLKSCDIEYVCFLDAKKDLNGRFEEIGEKFYQKRYDNNLYFYPPEKSKTISTNIAHVDMGYFSDNPYCFKIENGQVTMRLNKKFNETEVRIS